MQEIIFVLSIAFVAVSLMSLIYSLYNLFLTFKKKSQKSISETLEMLNTGQSAKEKGEAFVSLMEQSYITVHTIVNEGNKYSDEVQSKSFCDSLTQEVVNKINELGEKNGQCTFRVY